MKLQGLEYKNGSAQMNLVFWAYGLHMCLGHRGPYADGDRRLGLKPLSVSLWLRAGFCGDDQRV